MDAAAKGGRVGLNWYVSQIQRSALFLRMTMNSAASRLRPSASEVSITSRWCNRALRPLTSTILRLEKHWKITPLGAPNLNGITVSGSSQKSNSAAKGARGASESESESTPDDPTWVPGGAVRKHIRHKYSARTGSRSRVVVRSPETLKLQPGEFSIPTPLIKGKKRQCPEMEEPNGDASGVAAIADSNEDSSTQNSRRGPMKRKLPAYAGWNSQRIWKDSCNEYNDPSYIAIAQGIFQVWDTFLTMTAPEKSSGPGARSLMSMALGTTSMYIASEQEAVDNCEDKNEKVDVADLIFTELESIYGISNAGWKPLKSLVRLHGIRLVCDAIRHRWISPMIARQLVLNSIDSVSYDAAQEILSALLSVTQSIEGPRHLDCSLFSSGSFGVFHTLATYVNKASHISFFFREVGSLLRDGIVPVEWIVTESMKPFVTHALRSISCEDDDCSASVLFIVNTILAASRSNTRCSLPTLELAADTDKLQKCDEGRCKLDSSRRNLPENPESKANEHLSLALNNSISSILGILCSAHIVRFTTHSPTFVPSASPMHHILVRVSAIIQHDILDASFDLAQDRPRSELLRVGHILMADYILKCSWEGAKKEGQTAVPGATKLLSTFEYFTRTLKSRKDLTASLSTFVTHVSHSCGRALSEDGFTQLQIFTDALTEDNLQPYPALKALLGKVAVDAALKFAESTLHPDHHSWAAHIQTKAARYSNGPLGHDEIIPLTPSLALSKTGYIWEESIGEWIAAAPASGAYRSLRACKAQNQFLPNPPDELPTSSDADDATASGGSSTFSACSEGYNSSITSSEFTSPSWSRKRKRGVNSPNLVSGKHARTTYSSSLKAPPRRLRSGKSRSWSFYIDERESHDSNLLIFDRFKRSKITKKKHYVVEPSITKTRPLCQRTDINRSLLNPATMEVRLPGPQTADKAVEVVIVHDRKKYIDTESSSFLIQEERERMLPGSDRSDYNRDYDLSDHNDDSDGDDEDVLAREPSSRYLLRRKSLCTPIASKLFSCATPPGARLRTTRSSTSLQKQPILQAAGCNIVGSSDDELSFF
ncbi:hypothetical protein BDDG_08037 [Blastomyces dermatitidis ATCC 18188]|uniref:Uncharacterized protein n=1 Tax=Ajellomyces dermatitidis (strain ATCC 18188 / CBS 674.68) TaxID=653446 RepID=F2TPC9_AJEDA|nr:hypothetical protein BDDG_08037 [Blastomyces dermatitidis ATCC 18188]